MSSNEQKVEINICDSTTGFDIDYGEIEKLVKYTCEKFSVASAIVSVALVDDEMISDVHKDFMDDDSVTDVISFDLSDEGDTCRQFEMIVNVEMAQRQSQERGHKLQAEVCLYVLHGLLHNIGFDDLTEKEFDVMHETEDEILTSLGYGTVYGERKW